MNIEFLRLINITESDIIKDAFRKYFKEYKKT